MQTLGSNIFEDCEDHLFEHTFRAECDHLSCLTRMVTRKLCSSPNEDLQ